MHTTHDAAILAPACPTQADVTRLATHAPLKLQQETFPACGVMTSAWNNQGCANCVTGSSANFIIIQCPLVYTRFRVFSRNNFTVVVRIPPSNKLWFLNSGGGCTIVCNVCVCVCVDDALRSVWW